MSLPGWATTEGTANYRKRFEGKLSADHFREQHETDLPRGRKPQGSSTPSCSLGALREAF